METDPLPAAAAPRAVNNHQVGADTLSHLKPFSLKTLDDEVPSASARVAQLYLHRWKMYFFFFFYLRAGGAASLPRGRGGLPVRGAPDTSASLEGTSPTGAS